MRSTTNQLPVTHVSDACTTQRERISPGRTWRVRLFRQYAPVHHARVLANKINQNDIFNFSPHLDSGRYCNGQTRGTTTSEERKCSSHRDGGPQFEYDKARPTTIKTATHVAYVLLDHFVVTFAIPDHLQTENGRKPVRKVLATLSGFPSLKHLTSRSYQIQTNAHVKRYQKTEVTRERYYIDEHQDSWILLVQVLAYS